MFGGPQVSLHGPMQRVCVEVELLEPAIFRHAQTELLFSSLSHCRLIGYRLASVQPGLPARQPQSVPLQSNHNMKHGVRWGTYLATQFSSRNVTKYASQHISYFENERQAVSNDVLVYVSAKSRLLISRSGQTQSSNPFAMLREWTAARWVGYNLMKTSSS